MTNCTRTGSTGRVHVGARLVVDPVEAGLDGEAGEKAVLGPVPVRGGEVDGSSLVVEAVPRVVVLLVPRLCHAQAHARPLVHYGDGEGVQLLLAALQQQHIVSQGSHPTES